MATRICPDCGAQYVATVRRCIDCDVVLVDEVTPGGEGEVEVSSAAPVGEGEEVGYELEGWGNQLKVTLEGMLDRAGIPRAWEAGALVVSARHEETVDDLISTLEGGEISDLDEDVPRVALEIEGLDADGHDDLDARLIAQGIAHSWDDDGVLLVTEDDEERVLAVIDEALSHDGDDDDTDGLAAQQALSALYVAVDKLVKGPDDRKPATAFVRAAASLDGLSVPYGFSGADWASLRTDAADLAALVARFADSGAADAAGDRAGDDEADEVDPDDAALDDADVDGDTDSGERDTDGSEADDEAGGARVADASEAARALRARLVDLV